MIGDDYIPTLPLTQITYDGRIDGIELSSGHLFISF